MLRKEMIEKTVSDGREERKCSCISFQTKKVQARKEKTKNKMLFDDS